MWTHPTFGMRAALSRIPPISSSSSSASRVRGLGVEIKNPSKRRSSCRISTLLRAQKNIPGTHFDKLRVSAARGRSGPSLRQQHGVHTGYSLVCVWRCRVLSLLRAAVLLRPESEELELSSNPSKRPSSRRMNPPFATIFCNFRWPRKKYIHFLTSFV